jgi:uncharacterized protein YaaN involved in tellurite resistance
MSSEDTTVNSAAQAIDQTVGAPVVIVADVAQTDLSKLPTAQVEKAKAIAESFDINSPQAIMDFGSGAQRGISQFSADILQQVRVADAGQVGDVLTRLMFKVKDVDIDGLTPSGSLAKLPIVGPLFDATRHWLAKFEKVNVEIEQIEAELDKSQRGLTKDVVMFDQLFAQNKAFFDDLNTYIAAGEIKIKELREVSLPALQAEAAASNDPMDAQKVKDLASAIDRFEKKVHNLRLSRMIAIQTAPQIRIIQGNDQVLVEKIQSSIMNTLPLWRSQIVIGVGLARQQRAMEMQQEVDKTTNELLSKNSEMLKQGSIKIAEMNERGIVDIETLRKVNEDLITTIDETLRIQAEGRTKREEVEKELVTLEDDLRKKAEAIASAS